MLKLKQKTAENLHQLASQRGDMHWFSAYSNVLPEKIRKQLAKAAAISLMLLPVGLFLLAVTEIGDEFLLFVAPVMIFFITLYFRFENRSRFLERAQSETWYYQVDKHRLLMLDAEQVVAEYPVMDEGKLFAGRALFKSKADGYVLILEYRRPYPAMAISLLTYTNSKREDRVNLKIAAKTMADNMNLPLECSGLD